MLTQGDNFSNNNRKTNENIDEERDGSKTEAIIQNITFSAVIQNNLYLLESY